MVGVGIQGPYRGLGERDAQVKVGERLCLLKELSVD